MSLQQINHEVKKKYLDWVQDSIPTQKVEWYKKTVRPNPFGEGFLINVRVNVQQGHRDEDPIRVIFEAQYFEGQPTAFLSFLEIGEKYEMQKKYQTLSSTITAAQQPQLAHTAFSMEWQVSVEIRNYDWRKNLSGQRHYRHSQ